MQPTYYLFCFSPQTGDVHLTHDHESHPAKAKVHEDLGSEVGEQGLAHGYAYRIHGGWRLTDLDHDPLADHFIAKAVVKALKDREGQNPEALCDDCEPKESSFKRFHYGFPVLA